MNEMTKLPLQTGSETLLAPHSSQALHGFQLSANISTPLKEVL